MATFPVVAWVRAPLASRVPAAYTALMARNDLLALTDTDLADIFNRGNVRRARKELDQSRVSYELTEVDGTVTVIWSDGPTTVLPAGRVLADASCSCAAVGMCRHIVRAVLAYQTEYGSSSTDEGDGPRAARPWDPGAITDDELAAVFSSRRLAGYRQLFDEGLVVELVRSTKPLARFHRLRHTLRFLVPGDVRYTQCDCAEPAPCVHAVLAVWAFRRMGAGDADIIVTGVADESVDLELLARVEAALVEATRVGFANMPNVTMDGWRRLEHELRGDGLVWPAEILGALRRQYDHYQGHDARFSPDILAGLVGELLIRFDALRKEDVPIPRLFIRGDRADADAKLGQTRLVGLGCAVQLRHRLVEIEALLQDDSTGTVVGVTVGYEAYEAAGELLRALSAPIRVAIVAELGAGQVRVFEPESGSEDFSVLPDAWGVPYTYWGFGAFDAQEWAAAEAAGTVDDLPSNHSAHFAPVLQPVLDTDVAFVCLSHVAYRSQPEARRSTSRCGW